MFTKNEKFLIDKIDELSVRLEKLEKAKPINETKDRYSTNELCKIFEIERSTLQRWFVSKKLTPIKIVGRSYVETKELIAKFPTLFSQ